MSKKQRAWPRTSRERGNLGLGVVEGGSLRSAMATYGFGASRAGRPMKSKSQPRSACVTVSRKRRR